MNIQFYLEKLHHSDGFKEFMKENPDAFLCSGFFMMDFEKQNQDKQHFDFYLPKTEEIASFRLEEECKMVSIEMIEKKVPEKIELDYSIDLKEFEELILNKMEQENIGKKMQKILLFLQKIKEKDFFIGTVFISGLGLLKVKIDIKEKKIIDFEKKSFFDMLKITRKKKKN